MYIYIREEVLNISMLEKLARLFSTFRSDKLFNLKLLDSTYDFGKAAE